MTNAFRLPRRTKLAARKFTHLRRLTPKERRRFVRWIQGRHRAEGLPLMRPLPDGRYSVFQL